MLRRTGLIWLLLTTTTSMAQDGKSPFVDRVRTLETSLELDSRGQLGGVTVDQLGFLYVANFRDAVWKIGPDGDAQLLTRSLYGSSGNALDSRGNLYQANFFGHTISKITRSGDVSLFVTEGLSGPVGMAVGKENELYVCNCNGNTISRVSPQGKAELFAKSEMFACPNGIAFDGDGNLYVTNFNGYDIVKISPQGETSRFVAIPGGAGNAHIAFSKNFFYVTKIISNRVLKVSLQGEITPLAGTGQAGHDDGPALESTWFRPNGIAVSPQGNLLYINTLVGEYTKPKKSKITVRVVELLTLRDVLEEALESGGVDSLTGVYEKYKADQVRGKENTVAEMISFGYSLLSGRKVAEALKVFQLNAESYPAVAAAQYHYGEAFRFSGQNPQAIAQYRKVLEIEPGHAQATSRLAQLRQ